MGMYTQLKLDVKLRKDTPDGIINALRLITDSKGTDGNADTSHPLFNTPRWGVMTRMNGYFRDNKHPTLRQLPSGEWHLTNLSDVKNYDDEWEHYLDFLSPHVLAQEGEVVGHYHYEEWKNSCPIIYKDGVLTCDTETHNKTEYP